MTPLLLLKTMAERGVTLTPGGDRLRLAAPKGVLTDELCQMIATHKAALLTLLASGDTGAAPTTPNEARLPCVVCTGTVRWNHHGIWRCVMCWPREVFAPEGAT
jgi:hypothetical protein